jgi:hypothetical protein
MTLTTKLFSILTILTLSLVCQWTRAAEKIVERDLAAIETDCVGSAETVAKMNLDQVAKSHGFDSANLDKAKTKFVVTKVKQKGIRVGYFEMTGTIKDSPYGIVATVDGSCGVTSITLKSK